MKQSIISILTLCTLHSSHAAEINFNRDVRPILSQKCYFCHGPDAKEIGGDLQLHSFELATSKRDGKGAAIIPGKFDNSLFADRILTKNPDDIMPPPKTHRELTKKEIEILKQWVNSGAKYEKLWSFVAIPKTIPTPKNANEKHPIDTFIAKQLQQEKLKLNARSAPEKLLRKIHLTLTGLPPTTEQVIAFTNNPNEDVYLKIVDTLLATKTHAEHLSSEWMDVARYADSYGYQQDKGRQVWPYRDWVINSFHSNLNYDKFITHQLAGDLVADTDDQKKIATAFNRLHMQKVEGGSDPKEFKAEYIADRVHTTGTAFMGLTMECCRCHDHKYDPISTKEYYSFSGFFNNIEEEGLYSFFTNAVPSPSMPVMSAQQKAKNKSMREQVTSTHQKLTALKVSEQELKNWLTSSPAFKLNHQERSFDFSKASKGKLPNSQNPKQAGSYNQEYSKIIKNTAGTGLQLDGDQSIKVGKPNEFYRWSPFSISIDLLVPKQYQRANIIHRTRGRFDAGSRGYALEIIDGKLQLALTHFSPGNELRVEAAQKLAINQRHQITVTYDGSSKAKGVNIYINGTKQALKVYHDHLTKNIFYNTKISTQLEIGARFRDNGLTQGIVYQTSFYNEELTALEAQLLHGKNTVFSDIQKAVYYKKYHHAPAVALRKQLEAQRKAYAQHYDTLLHLMVMKEKKTPTKTYVLTGGLFSNADKSEELSPAPPQAPLAFGKKFPKNRLGLAQWLTHPQQPLTARVTVNRYWQMIFGRGLVETSNDFGFQGSYPSHPQLLDYMSRSFIDSGWDLRKLLRLMVTSKAFTQSSNTTPEILVQDPYNKLLSRGPSNFMTAEMLRDSALFSTNALSLTSGGASIHANHLHQGKYRRSLYSQWMRNNPSPSMLIFGAPRRQVCTVKREKTITPLQPLVLLNSPLFIESSKLLAIELSAKLDDDANIDTLFMKLLSRKPAANEHKIVKQLLNEQRQYFKAKPKAAEQILKVGKLKGVTKTPIETAAWTITVNTLMNTDSFYMIR